jgi:hypothetical protein
MSVLLDRLEDGFPHATREGFERGCRGVICPGREVAGFTCAEAWVRFQGDWAFRRRVLAGWSPEEIGALDAAEAEAARMREAESRKRARRAPRGATISEPVTKPIKAAGEALRTAPSGRRPYRIWTLADDKRIRELHALRMNDAEIAREIGRDRRAVQQRRSLRLHLPSNYGGMQ